MSEIVDELNPTQLSDNRNSDSINTPSTEDLQNIPAAHRLNGKNYLKWSQFVRTFLKGRGKISHLLGIGPKPGDPRFDAWDEADAMVMSWLLWNSMVPEISDTCMFLPTSKEIWEAVEKTYSKVGDAAQIYEIKTKIAATKQGGRSVTEYANLLKILWQEMDYYQCFQMKCSTDAALMKRFVEKERIYEFLAGQNGVFDLVRVQVLGKEDLPSLDETIAAIRSKESRREVMVESQSVESSAMVTRNAIIKYSGPSQQPLGETEQTNASKVTNKDFLWCTYCKKPRHTRER